MFVCKALLQLLPLQTEGGDQKMPYVLQAFPDGASARRVKRLLVRCTNKNCSWKNELGNLGEHLGRCEYTVVLCSIGCGEQVVRTADGLHHRYVNECGYAIVGCGYIGIEEHLKDHHKEAIQSHLLLAVKAFRPRHVAPVVLKMKMFDIQGPSKFWTSPPFYSHVSGYKLCLRISASGYGEGKGTHVSVYVGIMKGENDDKLVWPLRAKFRVALLNQLDDSRHFERHFVMDSNESKKYNSRVRDAERSPYPWGEPTFISHKELLERENGAIYYADNAAFFKVEVEVLAACKP
eukprot:Em0003g689a